MVGSGCELVSHQGSERPIYPGCNPTIDRKIMGMMATRGDTPTHQRLGAASEPEAGKGSCSFLRASANCASAMFY